MSKQVFNETEETTCEGKVNKLECDAATQLTKKINLHFLIGSVQNSTKTFWPELNKRKLVIDSFNEDFDGGKLSESQNI